MNCAVTFGLQVNNCLTIALFQIVQSFNDTCLDPSAKQDHCLQRCQLDSGKVSYEIYNHPEVHGLVQLPQFNKCLMNSYYRQGPECQVIPVNMTVVVSLSAYLLVHVHIEGGGMDIKQIYRYRTLSLKRHTRGPGHTDPFAICPSPVLISADYLSHHSPHANQREILFNSLNMPCSFCLCFLHMQFPLHGNLFGKFLSIPCKSQFR